MGLLMYNENSLSSDHLPFVIVCTDLLQFISLPCLSYILCKMNFSYNAYLSAFGFDHGKYIFSMLGTDF